MINENCGTGTDRKNADRREFFKAVCGKCGATRVDQQMGLEEKLDCSGWATGNWCGKCYVCHLTDAFEHVWDVLADDGVVFLNLGDCYSRGKAGRSDRDSPQKSATVGSSDGRVGRADRPGHRCGDLGEKQLLGMPWRVALALQSLGWYLRRDIVWYKPNAMPESVEDRPTTAHEYVFLLTKSERYFWDRHGYQEPIAEASLGRISQARFCDQTGGEKDYGRTGVNANRSARKTVENFAKNTTGQRNIRSVWSITTKGYAGAHFATFPTDIPRRAILLATSARGHCPTCAAGWKRITEKGEARTAQQEACGGDANGEYHGEGQKDYSGNGVQNPSEVKARILAGMRETVTLGWYPACKCYGVEKLPDFDEEPSAARDEALRLIAAAKSLPVVPAVVGDFFFGSGTTGQVAQELGRRWIGVDLNRDYEPLQRQRTAQPGLFLGAT